MGEMTEAEYRNAKAWIVKFDRAIDAATGDEPPHGIAPMLYQATIDAMRSQRADLQALVDEYEREHQ